MKKILTCFLILFLVWLLPIFSMKKPKIRKTISDPTFSEADKKSILSGEAYFTGETQNAKVFVMKSYVLKEEELGVKDFKNFSLGTAANRKKIRNVIINKNKEYRKAYLWSYLLSQLPDKLGKLKSEIKAKVKSKLAAGKSIQDAISEVLNEEGIKPLSGIVELLSEAMKIKYLSSKLRNFKIDKNNNGVDDLEEMGKANEAIVFPKDDGNGTEKHSISWLFHKSKTKLSDFSSLEDFVTRASFRKYIKQVKYKKISKSNPSMSQDVVVTIEEYQPIRIAVNYEGTIAAPGNIMYIDLWEYFWYELFKTSLVDNCSDNFSYSSPPSGGGAPSSDDYIFNKGEVLQVNVAGDDIYKE